MDYSELRMEGLPSATIKIEPGHLAIGSYDVDKFGQDDGSSRDPNDSFRLILELGAGYFSFLYVVGMAQPDGLGRFTSFWFKSIVTVDMEMEEYGEQSFVEGAFEVPVNFTEVTLWRGDQQTARHAVIGCDFEATTKQHGSPILTMRWRLSGDEALVWTNATTNGWSLGARQLDADEKVTFLNPVNVTR